MKKRSSAARPAGDVDVFTLIVGGGFGGLSTGIYLKRMGFHDFRIIEKAAGLGGTWWDNHYPGAEVDVHSHLYSLPFKRFDWSRTHAQQAELQRYIKDLVDEYDLSPHVTLLTSVVEAVWEEDAQRYRVQLSTGEVVLTRVLISADGLMNTPNYPDWPGLESFEGPKFHTARWEHEHDLAGKTVAVVGTGSTSSQVVASLAPIVGKLYVFQREPGWVMPKADRDFTPEERARFANESELRRRWTRMRHFLTLMRRQWRAGLHRPDMKVNKQAQAAALAYLDSVFADRPDLREAFTPKYPFSGKRAVVNSHYFPAFLRDNVELIPRAVVGVTPTGVVDAGGVETPVDVLVMATGFQQAKVLQSLHVVGRGGRSLREMWGEEPRALLGITVPDVPNFFMIYGPNTNGGEYFTNLRAQSLWAARSIKRLLRHGGTIETRRRPFEIVDRWIQRSMRKTSWVVSNNYYKSSTGRIVTQWPFDAFTYRLCCQILYHIGLKHCRAK